MHARLVLSQWEATEAEGLVISIDGKTLKLADCAVLAKHRGSAHLSDEAAVTDKIQKCVTTLNKQLQEGKIVYGVNTGYGGSADVRCNYGDMHKLQQAFLQHLNCGILPTINVSNGIEVAHSPSLKQEWVRAAMLIRANTVARGHSAVRKSTIETLLKLLTYDIIPVIPTRGSISASGDLTPLSYVAGLLESNPGIYCWAGPSHNRQITSAPQALASVNIEATVFQPKEALGFVNGTAISAAAASLTMVSMNNLLALSQFLTAMNVEAILGTATSFAPFISDIRPHLGQKEVASTIFNALKGSKLATGLLENHQHTLFQDRYSLRTVPQWLGPFLEDLLLANEQLTVELNSTTDNPLIDPDTGHIYHGGNFQAVSVTSAMEKCRLAAQAIGRMLFSQFTEMVNPATNRGLPPNLCVDEPSTSFTFKGVDTNMAGYMSELSFLANPVHNHVVCAEMGNQALNSLALISARYTDTAVDVLSIMCACTLYGTCQALDLRAMHRIFERKLKSALEGNTTRFLLAVGADESSQTRAKEAVWNYVSSQLVSTTTLDSKPRFEKIMTGAKAPLISILEEISASSPDLLTSLRRWATDNTRTAIKLFNETRATYINSGDATSLLGRASKRIYHFIRKDLKVPMHRGIIDHPMYEAAEGECDDTTDRKRTIGHWIGIIHEAIKDDRIMGVIATCLREGLSDDEPQLMPQHAKESAAVQ